MRDGVDFVQIREKDLPGRRLAQMVGEALRLTVGTKTQVLVNDRLDVALQAGAHGVHLPSQGLPAARVRAVVPPKFLVGVSTHGLEDAKAAEEAGADFIFFGPVFETRSKPGAPAVGLKALEAVARSVALPVFALGGVDATRVEDVAAAGARGIAAISAFHDPVRMAELLRAVASTR